MSLKPGGQMAHRAAFQIFVGLSMLFCATALAITENSARKSFVISRTDNAPIIDGLLDEDVWKSAAVVDDFHQTVPTDGGPPTERTVVHVMYDDHFLYIAADVRDSDASTIRVLQLIQGKPFFSDDRFWVTLDSFNSKRNDYFF